MDECGEREAHNKVQCIEVHFQDPDLPRLLPPNGLGVQPPAGTRCQGGGAKDLGILPEGPMSYAIAGRLQRLVRRLLDEKGPCSSPGVALQS